ncbi:hypothetical protein JK386_14590 [Nocardioides sp. zg-536]|uniref:Mce-associated membrane protein n=1 Tax=Nocardioides faecalis TaxID=2803858 RepID=A0A939BWY8_9ACTN|nr:hypothetical protein [Nocardioides faecalis]MBM9461127.1 hypothetical protein [Nocardioides faecalis]QVI58983.1 hypothetical protein KG111_00845 [Nocardioides faecalis]
MSRRVLALLVAVVLAATAVGWLATRTDADPVRPEVGEDARYRAGTVPTAPDGAVQAVAEALPEALGYDHTRLDDDLAEAKAVMTPAFSEEYATTFDATVRPLATSKQAVSEAHVRAAGVVSSSGDDAAVVLAYVDQVLLSSAALKKKAEPVEVSQTRVLVGVRRVEDRWLLDSVDPL